MKCDASVLPPYDSLFFIFKVDSIIQNELPPNPCEDATIIKLVIVNYVLDLLAHP